MRVTPLPRDSAYNWTSLGRPRALQTDRVGPSPGRRKGVYFIVRSIAIHLRHGSMSFKLLFLNMFSNALLKHCTFLPRVGSDQSYLNIVTHHFHFDCSKPLVMLALLLIFILLLQLTPFALTTLAILTMLSTLPIRPKAPSGIPTDSLRRSSGAPDVQNARTDTVAGSAVASEFLSAIKKKAHWHPRQYICSSSQQKSSQAKTPPSH